MATADLPTPRADARLLDRALALGIACGRALDVGCGAGDRAIALASHSPSLEIVGIDREPEAIALASAKAAAAGLAGRVRFLRGDAKRLPLRSAGFDLVLSDDLLHRLEAILPALNEIARVARPGAAILLRDRRRASALSPRGLLAWLAARHDRDSRAALAAGAPEILSLADARRLVERSRLRDVRVVVERGAHILFERRAAPDAPPATRDPSRSA